MHDANTIDFAADALNYTDRIINPPSDTDACRVLGRARLDAKVDELVSTDGPSEAAKENDTRRDKREHE
jgi:hypothetical protein